MHCGLKGRNKQPRRAFAVASVQRFSATLDMLHSQHTPDHAQGLPGSSKRRAAQQSIGAQRVLPLFDDMHMYPETHITHAAMASSEQRCSLQVAGT